MSSIEPVPANAPAPATPNGAAAGGPQPAPAAAGAAGAGQENAPVPADRPARTAGATAAGAVVGVVNFLTLAARVTALSAAALRLKENAWALQRHMEDNAGKAQTLSEMCDAAEVEPQYTALIMESSKALRRVANASGELADTADVMETHARGFNDAHESENRGVYEAVQASAVRQPKPGFNRVR